MIARHEYEGRICGTRYELFLDSDNVPNTMECCSNDCNDSQCVADLSFDWGIASGLSVAGEQTFGVKYFVNPRTGHKIVAGTAFSQAPPGYRVEQTTSFHEVELLEKSINAQESSKSARAREGMAAMTEMLNKQHRQDELTPEQVEKLAREQGELRKKLVAEQAQEMGLSSYKEYEPKLKDPAARARLAVDTHKAYLDSEDAKSSDFKAIDPGVHFDCLHNDSPFRGRTNFSSTKATK